VDETVVRDSEDFIDAQMILSATNWTIILKENLPIEIGNRFLEDFLMPPEQNRKNTHHQI
jgi:hypothetical protein